MTTSLPQANTSYFGFYTGPAILSGINGKSVPRALGLLFIVNIVSGAVTWIVSTIVVQAIRQIFAAPDAALFLWTTGPHLPEALCVIERWGFAYKENLKPQGIAVRGFFLAIANAKTKRWKAICGCAESLQ